MTRRDIEFDAESATLRGWFYPATGESSSGNGTVVMAHGFSAVKEMYLDAYVDGFDISSGQAIDWFLNHLTGACS